MSVRNIWWQRSILTSGTGGSDFFNKIGSRRSRRERRDMMGLCFGRAKTKQKTKQKKKQQRD